MITGKNFLILLMYTNLFIVAFNLIPAFPMDGGRILRAALSLRFYRVRATRYSMKTGQVFGATFAKSASISEHSESKYPILCVFNISIYYTIKNT